MALAGYFEGLRDGRGMTQTQLAARLGELLNREVDVTTIWRLETGRQRPSGEMLTALLDVLCGNFDDVRRLQRDRKATEETGRRFAHEWLTNGRSTPDSYDVRRQRAIALIDELLSDPTKLDRWLGYGDRLLEEQGQNGTQ